jgi:RHS repeat-associated protein
MRGPANGRRYRGFRHMIGFNGVVHEAGTRWQLLGNGRRVYNPMLMRFHSPDRLSPFGEGGCNAYAYCLGDPVNHRDPNGTFAIPLLLGLATIGGGAAAFAAPSASTDGREGGTPPWVIAMIVVGAAATAAALGTGMLKAARAAASRSDPVPLMSLSVGPGKPGTPVPLMSLSVSPGTRGPLPLLPESVSVRSKPRAPGKPVGTWKASEVIDERVPLDSTVQTVRKGKGFKFPNSDGETFHNEMGVLPIREHGYYRSYTVQHAHLVAKERGPMRLVTGGFDLRHPDAWYFSKKHYRDLKRFDPQR